ncbi:MAG: hypothetical protein ACI9JM_001236 [Halioglobus sp.]|jgi:hypothetical protein
MRLHFQNSFLILFLWLGTAAGCATLSADYDPPKVSMEGIRSLPSAGGAPRFEIKLRVANPNTEPLDIAGVSYTLELLGKELVSGVTNEVPKIEGYSDEVITLEASLQMLEVLRLLASLGTTQTDALAYRFTAKIDFRGFMPTQRIEETGELTLN